MLFVGVRNEMTLHQPTKSTIPYFTQEQERALLVRARNGENVRDDILLLFQPRLYALAAIYVRKSRQVEWGDLVSVANIALLERMKVALTKHNPYGYLQRVAQLTMIAAISGRNDLIKTHSEVESVPIQSLDVPLCEDGSTLADLLPIEVRIESSALAQARYAARYAALHKAIEALPEKQRLVIEQHYGFGYSPEPMNAISRSLSPHTPHPSTAYYYNRRALKALRRALLPFFPQYNAKGEKYEHS